MTDASKTKGACSFELLKNNRTVNFYQESVSCRSSEKKVLNLKEAFQRTFNRPLSSFLLLLQFQAKAIVSLTIAFA